MRIAGIDVGLTGSLAILNQNGSLYWVGDLPVMASGKGDACVKQQINAAVLYAHLKRDDLAICHVYVEGVSARPMQGISSAFSLGQSFGTVLAVLACVGLSYTLVTPTIWKKAMGLAGIDKKLAKEASRTKAIQLFPDADLARVKDHGRAEALLIARYGWELQRG